MVKLWRREARQVDGLRVWSLTCVAIRAPIVSYTEVLNRGGESWSLMHSALYFVWSSRIGVTASCWILKNRGGTCSFESYLVVTASTHCMEESPLVRCVAVVPALPLCGENRGVELTWVASSSSRFNRCFVLRTGGMSSVVTLGQYLRWCRMAHGSRFMKRMVICRPEIFVPSVRKKMKLYRT